VCVCVRVCVDVCVCVSVLEELKLLLSYISSWFHLPLACACADADAAILKFERAAK
jgi:hypothetical protein